MSDYLRHLLARSHDATQGRNLVREALQAGILASLQRAGAFSPLAFHGGTALRFLFAIDRYSEDLDFALERPDRPLDFRALLRSVKTDLVREGHDVDVRVSDHRTVLSALLRFPGLLQVLGLAGPRTAALSIKIEVDTRPPAGATLDTTVTRRHVPLHLQHHDKASLLAGKIHAVLARPYMKGRDLYDLAWYLSDPSWPSPNIPMLTCALLQTGWSAAPISLDSWRSAVRERLGDADWPGAVADVRPFLGPASDPRLISQESLFWLLRD